MAQQQAPDDIFALYCRFDLDVSQYHVFERGEVNFLDAPPTAPASQTAEQAAIAIPFAAEAPKPPSPEKIIGSQAERAPETREDRIPDRAGLRNLLTNVHQLHDRSASSSFGSPCQRVAVFGSSGGVGVTTVMATLARLLTKQGLRCGLYDDADESLLPYFFGFHRIAAHPSRFAGLSAVLEPAVRLLGPGNAPSNSASLSGEFTMREKVLRSQEHDLDFSLADHGYSVAEIPAETSVFVALPDLSSVANIRALVNRTGWACRNDRTVCVLNRFDPEVALHRELLAWYEQQFAQVVTIGHSYLVPESLAEGTSVVELAPDSEVTGDFARLAASVRQTAMHHSAILKRGESPKNQLEGLALCS